MMIFVAALLVIGVLVFTLSVRPKDLPEPEPVSPVKHLEERKATIYENLRDLQFEYRVGKLSELDYARTKTDLQRQLAAVLAEIDKVVGVVAPVAAVAQGPAVGQASTPAAGLQTRPPAAPAPVRDREGATLCPHCGAHFPNPMKFCGECGKPIPVEATK
ncbi:MAG TPA: zinc ribbon domain-containing protein [Bryobacteraceae bacterium]|nr:zinc ribbon domain-containing protein [Bryobacteraceae bacterium]